MPRENFFVKIKQKWPLIRLALIVITSFGLGLIFISGASEEDFVMMYLAPALIIVLLVFFLSTLKLIYDNEDAAERAKYLLEIRERQLKKILGGTMNNEEKRSLENDFGLINLANLPPCKECGKTVRHDFDGYCMDCADENGISDIFPEQEQQENLKTLAKRRFTQEEKKENLKKMRSYLKKRNDDGEPVVPILVSRR